jgi:hypothetical protein
LTLVETLEKKTYVAFNSLINQLKKVF